MIYDARFDFFDFDMSSQNYIFSLVLPSEAIAINELGLIAP